MIYIPKQLTSSEVMTEAFLMCPNVLDGCNLSLLVKSRYYG